MENGKKRKAVDMTHAVESASRPTSDEGTCGSGSAQPATSNLNNARLGPTAGVVVPPIQRNSDAPSTGAAADQTAAVGIDQQSRAASQACDSSAAGTAVDIPAGTVARASLPLSTAAPESVSGAVAASSSASSTSTTAGSTLGASVVDDQLYVSRDELAHREEERGTLTYRVITNEGTEETNVWLTCAKHIFATQLPKMPREYIVRLLFDRKHYTMVLLKNGKVVGGICFRPNTVQVRL